ncbi:hypothetical protein BC938DRAFT_483443 [Jimgerdemannia flammicorona]|uniref:Uncharacterized protein n=1 Tax=Jimgerdemannia flammicorona TaxID=994334 RepID=A0A433QC27_9FUNG|nr:hypothetical protein BC938DRAFT_483443 [Jimgerdemannia flammicorona]
MSSYVCMGVPILWALQPMFGMRALHACLDVYGLCCDPLMTNMDISSELTSYFNDTNYEKWSCMDCLEYLKEVCAHLTSGDRDEIFQNYKAHLRSMNSRSSMLQRARNKANRLAEGAAQTFQRQEVVAHAKTGIYKSKLKIHVCDDKVVTLESASTAAYGDDGAGEVNARSKTTFTGSAADSGCTTPPRQITRRYDDRERNVDEDLAEPNVINFEETIVAAQVEHGLENGCSRFQVNCEAKGHKRVS